MVICMKKIHDIIESEIVIDKSRFITTLYPVDNVDTINDLLTKIRKKYYDATHNCYAYIIDNGNIQKCSDDGEPSKTAGYPMLDVLKKNDMTNVLAVTTRYFGGIKLGAGGLVRAYSSSVSTALKDVTFFESKLLEIYQVDISYPDYSKNIDFWNNMMIKESSFSDSVSLKIAFYENDIIPSLDKIKNLTLGKALINFLYKEYIDVKVD